VLAGFARYEHPLAATLRVSVAGRVDWLSDSFDARAPSDGERRAATHVAFSPKVGVNYGYASSERNAGYLYGNVARSFKAPTPDQLFDQRPIPVPTPPFVITFANADLEPQHGTNVEVGGSHRVVLAPHMFTAELAVSAYQLTLRDELDFDLETFRYQNIGRSLHRGIEAGLDVQGPESLTLFGNYTLQSATSRVGENAGKALKAIPRHFLSAGVAGGTRTGLTASVMVSGAWRAYLDDANTQELPAWTRWDLRLAYTTRGVRLAADVLNLWDRKYSTTGFPDAADPSVVYFYPAAPRTVQLGLSRGW
jgi:iron complex outermembrane receptor protein